MLYGFWVMILIISSVIVLKFLIVRIGYSADIVLLWAFAFIAGVDLVSFLHLSRDFQKRNKEPNPK